MNIASKGAGGLDIRLSYDTQKEEKQEKQLEDNKDEGP